MTKKILLLSTIGAMTLAGGAAFAAQNLTGGPMKQIDANGDGQVTRAEATAAFDKHFALVDKNKDGAITADERQAMHAERIAERGEKRFARLDANSDGSISRAEWDANREQRADRREHRGGGHHRGMMHGMRGGMGPGVDANKDGTVTKAEAQAAALGFFDRLDANKDGVIMQAEREQARAAWKARRAG